MAEDSIAAEVTPTTARHAQRAAKVLQQRGFRVLHIGRSISVQAPRELWEEAFGVTFRPRSKTVQQELGRRVTYPRADAGSVRVPADLQELIADVAFAEPPELH